MNDNFPMLKKLENSSNILRYQKKDNPLFLKENTLKSKQFSSNSHWYQIFFTITFLESSDKSVNSQFHPRKEKHPSFSNEWKTWTLSSPWYSSPSIRLGSSPSMEFSGEFKKPDNIQYFHTVIRQYWDPHEHKINWILSVQPLLHEIQKFFFFFQQNNDLHLYFFFLENYSSLMLWSNCELALLLLTKNRVEFLSLLSLVSYLIHLIQIILFHIY